MSKKPGSKIKLYTLPNEPSIAQQFAFKSICQENDTLRINCISPTFPSDTLSLFTQNIDNKLTNKQIKENMSAANATKRNKLKQGQFKGQIEKLTQQTKLLEKQNKKLKGKIKSYKELESMKILEKFKNSSEFQNVDLFLELQQMSSLYQKTKITLQKVETQNAQHTKKISDLQEQHQRDLQKYKTNSKYDQQANIKFQQNQAQWKQKMEAMTNEKQLMKKQNQQLKEANKQSEQKLSELKLLHEEVKKKLTNLNKQYKDLQDKFKKTQQSTGDSLKEKAQLLKQNQSIKNQHKKYFMELQQAKEKIFQLTKTINRLQMLNKEAEQKIEELAELREINFVSEKEKNQLKKNLDKSEKQVQKLLSQIEAKGNKISNLNKNIKTLEEQYQLQIQSLKGQLQQSSLIKLDYDKLVSCNKNLQQINQQLNEKIGEFEIVSKSLQQENQQMKQKADQNSKQFLKKCQQVQQYQRQIQKLKIQFKKLQFQQLQQYRLKRQRSSVSRKSIEKVRDLIGMLSQYVPASENNYHSNKTKNRQEDHQHLISQLVILVKSLIRYSENIKGQAELLQLKLNTIHGQNEQQQEEFQQKIKLKQEVIVKLVKLTPQELKECVIDYLYLTDKLAQDPSQQLCQQRQQIGNKLEIQIERWRENVGQLRTKVSQYEEQIYQLKRLIKGKTSKFSLQADVGKKDIMKKYGVLSNKQ